MNKELEKYVHIFETKSYLEIKDEFINVFNEIYSNISNYEIEDFAVVEQILSHYKNFRMFVDQKKKKKKQYIEEDRLYEKIIYSPFYLKFLDCKFLVSYPRCEESLYKLELEFLAFLKETEKSIDRKDKVINVDKYNEILATLDYLSDFINEKTVHIAHNILLYYKELKNKIEYIYYRDRNSLDETIKVITDENSNYQKYKR